MAIAFWWTPPLIFLFSQLNGFNSVTSNTESTQSPRHCHAYYKTWSVFGFQICRSPQKSFTLTTCWISDLPQPAKYVNYNDVPWLSKNQRLEFFHQIRNPRNTQFSPNIAHCPLVLNYEFSAKIRTKSDQFVTKIGGTQAEKRAEIWCPKAPNF